MKFTIGCDPELFIKDKYGHYKSAVDLIGGSKWAPLKLDEDGHAILEDNVALEFNIAPAANVVAFKNSIHKVLDHFRKILPDYVLDNTSAVSFPEEELNTPQAQEFGCEPDFNAWTKQTNPKPNAADQNLRSCGGHIHVGADIAQKMPIEVIKAMDLFLGVPSIRLDNGVLRRELYGKAGCFRKKDYGVEYRTLSNFWIFDNDLIEWAYNGTQRALNFIEGGHTINDEDGAAIQRCINTNNLADFDYLEKRFAL